jgi:rhodanese-related sulfurtransferase
MKRRLWLTALVVVCAIVAGVSQLRPEALKPLIGLRFPDLRWVDTRSLAVWMSQPSSERPIILDVRSEEEFRVSHLEGAIHVDPSQPRVESLPIPENAAVVVYCSVGYRSAAIVRALEESGITEVHNLEGGIFAWANEGRPVFRDARRAATVHSYDRLWGYLLREDLREPVESAVDLNDVQ